LRAIPHHNRHSREGGNPGHGSAGMRSPLERSGRAQYDLPDARSARGLAKREERRRFHDKYRPAPCRDVTWAPAFAGVTQVEDNPSPQTSFPRRREPSTRGSGGALSTGAIRSHPIRSARRASRSGDGQARGAEAQAPRLWIEGKALAPSAAASGSRVRGPERASWCHPRGAPCGSSLAAALGSCRRGAPRAGTPS
jgi:hypothetical protein